MSEVSCARELSLARIIVNRIVESKMGGYGNDVTWESPARVAIPAHFYRDIFTLARETSLSHSTRWQ
jgi:DNA/RNA endonuclease G (NUC1)